MTKATLRSARQFARDNKRHADGRKSFRCQNCQASYPLESLKTRQGHRATRKRGGTDACGRVSKLRRALSWGVTSTEVQDLRQMRPADH